VAVEFLERTRTEEFGEKMGMVLNHAALALMTSIGHRTGLFDTMAALPPSTTGEIAAAAGLSERYVREWLGAMVTGGIVEYDERRGTYALPPEHAAWLTRQASPQNVAPAMQWIGVLGGVETQVVEAFRHGRGVPYVAYNRFHEVMAEESAQTVVAALVDHIVPFVPELGERLEAGIDVLDVGCGSAGALIRLAEAFPNSRFTGYDFSEEAIGAARYQAARRGLRNVRLQVVDAAEIEDEAAFDLVTTFDAVHDQADPARVLRNIKRALRPDGVYLMQDIGVSSHLAHNHAHPVAPFIYTISTMHCMSVSLARDGAGLGAAWGKEKALEMLADAGFAVEAVDALPHDPFNLYFIVRHGRVN